VSGKYSTIVADPPWPVKDSGKRTAATKGNWERGAGTTGKPSVVPYERMSIEEIAQIPVADLAERDAHLYVWAVNAFLTEAYDVVKAWGFKPSTLLTWSKKPMGLGLGGSFVQTTEFIIFARRGSLAALSRVDRTCFDWRRPYVGNGGPTHSAKPDAFLDVVEQVSPAPRLEMFARRARFGWDYWGDQSLETAEMPEATEAAA
jgi:N6-adenosine-specific RNA methylase IME4